MEWTLSYGESVTLMFLLAILVVAWGIYRELRVLVESRSKND